MISATGTPFLLNNDCDFSGFEQCAKQAKTASLLLLLRVDPMRIISHLFLGPYLKSANGCLKAGVGCQKQSILIASPSSSPLFCSSSYCHTSMAEPASRTEQQSSSNVIISAIAAYMQGKKEITIPSFRFLYHFWKVR